MNDWEMSVKLIIPSKYKIALNVANIALYPIRWCIHLISQPIPPNILEKRMSLNLVQPQPTLTLFVHTLPNESSTFP